LVSYTPKVCNLRIVSVNGAKVPISTADIKTLLDKLFAPPVRRSARYVASYRPPAVIQTANARITGKLVISFGRTTTMSSDKFVEQKIGYIHQNPVRGGYVRLPEEYLYSSSSNYAGLP
jgi:hypothetical protein